MPEAAYSEQSLPGGSGTPPPAGRTPSPAAAFDAASGDSRVSVTVHAGLSHDAEQQIRSMVHQALSISDTGIDLDLSAVKSCDSFGLYLLLSLRRQAFEHGKTLTLC